MIPRVIGAIGLLLTAAFVFVGYRASTRAVDWALPKAVAPTPQPGVNSSQAITIVVNKGENALTIGDKLQKAGVIHSATWFRILADLDGIQNDLAAGSYTFQPGSDTETVLKRIQTQQEQPQILVTIPEGLRMEQVAALLEKKGVLTSQALLDAMNNDKFSGDLLQDRPQGASLQGYVFPDTYYFPVKATPEDILKEMLNALNDRVDPELRQAIQAEGLTVYQALTLASIVEREAQVPEERPIIASVFLNRLKQGMSLQADPTVQFAVAADPNSVAQYGWWKQDLTEVDLKMDSPYNTYKVQGLPPGPICNPGRDAIAAVAHPASTNFLYFVAKGDDGSHAFASTLAEHNANIAKYQKR